MSNAGDEKTRPVILLSREDDEWRAELPDLRPIWQSALGDIHSVVATARDAAETSAELKLKVAERTKLERPDVLALIEANGKAAGLDLSRCSLEHIDLSRETIQRERTSYLKRSGDDPPWVAQWFPPDVGVGLSGVQLQEADLVGAQLQGAFLMEAQLQGAFLAGAQLQGATLARAQLQGANLNEAQLQGAVLTEAQLQGANLMRARFHDAVLVGAQLQGALLMEAQLQGANLSYAQLQGVDFFSAQLERTYWHAARLGQTRMRREQLGKSIGEELAARGQNEKRATSFEYAKETYLLLRNNFESIARYVDASWAFIKAKQMEKAAYFPGDAGQQWLNAKRGGSYPPTDTMGRWMMWHVRSAVYNVILFLGFSKLPEPR